MTNYTKGVRLEREVMQLFRDAGWEAARTAGSHSFFDVVCVGFDRRKLVATILTEAGWKWQQGAPLYRFTWMYVKRSNRQTRTLYLLHHWGEDGEPEIVLIQCKTKGADRRRLHSDPTTASRHGTAAKGHKHNRQHQRRKSVVPPERPTGPLSPARRRVTTNGRVLPFQPKASTPPRSSARSPMMVGDHPPVSGPLTRTRS